MNLTKTISLTFAVLVSSIGCKTNDVMQSPCADTAQLATVTTDKVQCHPQASIHAAPVGSGDVVLVTCTCNVLPAPCDCGCSKGSCELPMNDGGTEQ